MVDIQVGIYSNDIILNDIVLSNTFVSNSEIQEVSNLSEIQQNTKICVYMISDKTLGFEELLLIPDFIDNNTDFDFIFYIPLRTFGIDPKNELYSENIEIRSKMSHYLKNLKSKRVYVSHDEESLLEDLHALYRSHKIGTLMGFESLHSL